MTRTGPAAVRDIARRPAPDPAVLAAIAVAAAEAVPRAAAAPRSSGYLVWRFSGRWWNKPTPIARGRPFAPVPR